MTRTADAADPDVGNQAAVALSYARPASVAGPQGAKARRKRAQIVAAACDVFLAEGLGASMDVVAARAGASKVTVYNHFTNKEALILAIIHDQLEDALAPAVDLVSAHLSGSSDVRADLVAACRAWVAGVASPRMLALRNLVAGEMRRMPELGAAWQQRGPQRFHPVVADALRKLCERGVLNISDVDFAVLQLSGLVVSPNLVYGAYGNRVPDTVADLLITDGVDMFLTYYASAEGPWRRERSKERPAKRRVTRGR